MVLEARTGPNKGSLSMVALSTELIQMLEGVEKESLVEKAFSKADSCTEFISSTAFISTS